MQPEQQLLPAPWAKLDYPSATILLQVTTEWEHKMRLHSCAKEPWTVAWVEDMPPDAIFFDIGANVGAYSLIAGRREIATWAFEPGYANYAALCNNIVANRLEGRITPLCVALSDRSGIQPFAYRNLEAGSASNVFDEAGAPSTMVTLPTLSMRLDTLLEYLDLPRPTYLKLDVDGAEPGVLEGAGAVLQTVREIMIEMPRDDARESALVQTLAGAGFVLSVRYDERNGETIPEVYYALWSRGET